MYNMVSWKNRMSAPVEKLTIDRAELWTSTQGVDDVDDESVSGGS